MERRAFIRHTGLAGVLAAAAAPAVVHAGGELMPPFGIVDGVQNGIIEMGHTVPCSRNEAMQGWVERNILSKKTVSVLNRWKPSKAPRSSKSIQAY